MKRDNGTKAKDAIEDVAEEARERVDQVVEDARDEFADVQNQLRDLRRELVSRAATVKDRAAEELRGVAQRIRREVEDVDDEDLASSVTELADNLEKSAKYLTEHSTEEIGEDVEAVVKTNPWPALGVSFVAGLVVGLLLGGLMRR